MDEHRQLPRWEIKKEAKVWMPQMQGASQCVIEDMHLKGMRVSFDKPLFQPQPLRMSFSLGEDLCPIKIEAQVPWEKRDNGRYVYGLSFSNITDKDKDRIYQYISTNCYDQFKKRWWE